MKRLVIFALLISATLIGCNHCMPCPYGIDIPAVFGFYNNSIAEDLLPEGDSSDNEFRKARRRWLIGYDKKVERMRQADHCIGCRKCVPLCPQKIKIHREMEKINTFV
jgi:predicted aldo/keto reductase-like oxidoreductase